MIRENIHPVLVSFGIPVSPGNSVERFVYVYVLAGKRLCLIDTGVAGAEKVIAAALQKIDKSLSEVDIILLTHSHPDHIGTASLIRSQSGAEVWAHPSERAWVEDIDRQERERPVPGFANLVAGSVPVDHQLVDGDVLSLGAGLHFRVLHTPGHSPGSISLLSEESGILFAGDVIPQPGGMPIYEDVFALASSLARLAEIDNLATLYSSWADPVTGQDAVHAIRDGIHFLRTVHELVMRTDSESGVSEPMDFCRRCVQALELPPYAVNPLVLRSLLAHKEAASRGGIDSILAPYLGRA